MNKVVMMSDARSIETALSIVRQFQELTHRHTTRTRSGNGKLILFTHSDKSIRKGIGIGPVNTHAAARSIYNVIYYALQRCINVDVYVCGE